MVANTAKRIFQISNGSINILQFFKTKQTQPECSEVGSFIALKRHSRSDLQSLLKKFFPVLR
jgi:hypothetical protein